MDFFSLILYFLVTIPSAIFHEYMHGWMADRLGDPTARYAGRLTLNPKSHIDLFGTILMPLGLFFLSGGRFLFAYAKPVPYNPYNLRNQRYGSLLVGIAGPLANFLLAIVFGLFLRFFPGSFLSPFIAIIVLVNISLGVFNLVPIPPLDGSKILYAFLPPAWHKVQDFLDRYGMWVLLIFVFYFSWVIGPVIDFLFNLIVG